MTATRLEIEESAFLYGGNGGFIEDLYSRYLEDPSAIDASWRVYFDELGTETKTLFQQSRAALERRPASGSVVPAGLMASDVIDLDGERSKRLILDHLRIVMLIRAFRVRGHLLADLDPLRLSRNEAHPELDPANYGFGEDDWDREFFLDNVLGLEKATLRQIVDILRQTYSAKIGVEFMHIQEQDQKAWIQAVMEGSYNLLKPTAEGKKEILQSLTAAEGVERF